MRGENAAGKGDEADVTVSTVELEWSFNVSSGEVRENRTPLLTVRARITNGKTAPVELEVELFWGGIPIGGSQYPGAALEGANEEGVHVIKIAQGATSGQLQVRGATTSCTSPGTRTSSRGASSAPRSATGR